MKLFFNSYYQSFKKILSFIRFTPSQNKRDQSNEKNLQFQKVNNEGYFSLLKKGGFFLS